jgi:hypothetical protein
MKKVIVLLTVIMVSASLMGQEPATNKTRAEKKAERKELKAKRAGELAATTEKAMNSGNYVVQTDQIRDKYGRMMVVNASSNFVAKRGNEAFVQFGPESGFSPMGSGVTYKGTVSNYKMTRDKKNGYYRISFYISCTMGTITVNITSNPTGETAEARVQTTFGNQISFSGVLVPVISSQKFTADSNK